MFCVIITGFNLFQSREKLGSILVTLQEVLAVETASNINNQIELSLFVLLCMQTNLNNEEMQRITHFIFSYTSKHLFWLNEEHKKPFFQNFSVYRNIQNHWLEFVIDSILKLQLTIIGLWECWTATGISVTFVWNGNEMFCEGKMEMKYFVQV